MKATVSVRSTVTHVAGVPCRIFEGHTDRGTPVKFLVAIVGVEQEDQSAFEQELKEWPEAEIVPLETLFPEQASVYKEEVAP